MRFSACLMLALSLGATAGAQDWPTQTKPAGAWPTQDMPAGGLEFVVPGYSLHSPGTGWTLTTPVPPLTSGARITTSTKYGLWLFSRKATGAAITVRYVRWPVAWNGDLESYVRASTHDENAALVPKTVNGARCIGVRSDSGAKLKLLRQVCLHPEHPGFAIDMGYTPAGGIDPGGVESEAVAVFASLKFAPIGYRIREVRPGCETKGFVEAAGALWIGCADATNSFSGKGSVMRLDPATNTLGAPIPFDQSPFDMASAFGAIWVTSNAGLSRIDLQNARLTETTTLPVRPSFIFATRDALWVATTREPWPKAELLRVDPVSRAVGRRFLLRRLAAPFIVTDHGVFFHENKIERLRRLDLVANRITVHAKMGKAIWPLRFDGRYIMMSGNDGSGPVLLRFDPRKPDLPPVVTKRLPLLAHDAVEWNGELCILGDQSIMCFPGGNTEGPAHEIPLEAYLPANLHVFAGSLWLEDYMGHSILRIDPK